MMPYFIATRKVVFYRRQSHITKNVTILHKNVEFMQQFLSFFTCFLFRKKFLFYCATSEHMDGSVAMGNLLCIIIGILLAETNVCYYYSTRKSKFRFVIYNIAIIFVRQQVSLKMNISQLNK